MSAKAYPYARCSRAEQLKGDSLERQRRMVEEFCRDHDLEVDDTLDLSDRGLSGWTGENRTRGALRRFVEAIGGEVPRGSYLLIENIDRLSREPVLEAFDNFRAIIKAGITIVTLDNGWILTEASLSRESWKLHAIISMMERAFDESAQKSRRLREAMAQKRKLAAEHCVPFSRNAPAWLMFDEAAKRHVLNPDRAPAFVRMLELAACGVGQYSIGRILEREGFNPPKGGSWQTSYISKTIRNEALIGTFRANRTGDDGRSVEDVVVPNYWPAVVSVDLFQRAQAARKPFLEVVGRKGAKHSNLFGKIAFCRECKEPMTLFTVSKAKRNRFQYLICSGKRRGLGCKAPKNFRYDRIEAGVLKHVHEIDLSRFMKDDVADARLARAASEAAEAEHALSDLNRRIESVMDDLETAPKARKEALQARLDKRLAERPALEKQIRELRRDRERLEAQKRARCSGPETAQRLYAELATATPDEAFAIRAKLAATLRTFISRILFYQPTTPVGSGMVEITIMNHLRTYCLSGEGELRLLLGRDPYRDRRDPETYVYAGPDHRETWVDEDGFTHTDHVRYPKHMRAKYAPPMVEEGEDSADGEAA